MGENDSEIFGRLGRIEQTLARIDERTKASADHQDDHETRIRTLERENDKRKGAFAVLTVVVSALMQGAAWLIKHLTGGN